MARFVSIVVAVAGTVLYLGVANGTAHEEGWILWRIIGLLLAGLGAVGVLFDLGERSGALDDSPKSGIARAALAAAVGILCWFAARLMDSVERDCFEVAGVMFLLMSLLILAISFLRRARHSNR